MSENKKRDELCGKMWWLQHTINHDYGGIDYMKSGLYITICGAFNSI